MKRFEHPSPFDPRWRDFFEERKTAVRLIFEPEYGIPRYPYNGWLVENLLARGTVALLAGKPKEGKTCLTASLAYAVSQGIPFAGMNTYATNVLYFAAEESPEEWEYSIDPHLPEERPGFRVGHCENFRIDREADLWGLRMAVDHYKAGLIVINPLLAACTSGDLSNGQRARNAIFGLKSLCMEKGVSAIVIHHAKERRGLARRVAENPQLAATAGLNIVLNQRKHPKGRLITLDMSGRGFWANRKIKLLSKHPGHYLAYREGPVKETTPANPD